MNPNAFQTTDWLSMKAVVLLTNTLEVTSCFDGSYEQEFKRAFNPGDTIRIGYTPRFRTANTLSYQNQGIEELYTTLSVNQIVQCGFEWNDVEEALKLERDDRRLNDFYIKSPMSTMAQEVDSRSARFAYENANQIAGVLGTDPTTLPAYSNIADQKLFEMACPDDGKRMLIIPASVNTALAASAMNFFNPADAISRQYKKGVIGMQANFTWARSNSLYDHTAGAIAGAFTLAAAIASGANTMTVNLTANDTLFIGDVIGIAGCYNTNPSTRRRTTTAYTKTVVVTQDLVAAGGGADVIQFKPTLYGPGSKYQNIDVLPGATALLTLFPGTGAPSNKTGKQGLAIHEKAFAIAGVPLDVPENQQIARQSKDPETGIWIRFIRAFDPIESRKINRFDMLFGYGELLADSCCVRMLGA